MIGVGGRGEAVGEGRGVGEELGVGGEEWLGMGVSDGRGEATMVGIVTSVSWQAKSVRSKRGMRK